MMFRATVIEPCGKRSTAFIECPSRAEAERILDAAYPDTLYTAVIRIDGGCAC